MSPKDDRVRDLVTEQAADWWAANRTGVSAREREAFAAWLKISPVHVEEYLGIAALAGDLRDACAELASSVDSLVAQARAAIEEPTPIGSHPMKAVRGARPGRWGIPALAVYSLGALGLSLMAWWNFGLSKHERRAPTEAAATFHFATRHGEQQTHRLPDESIVHLNTDTSITVRISTAERQVTLEAGEVEFEVAHEPKRPFRVLARSTQVLDLGTQFDIRLEPDVTVITVLEGRVAVGPGSAAAEFINLAANQQMRVAQWPPAAPVVVDAHKTTSWMRRQITFEHEPLARVAREFNRYASKPIEITTPALGKLEISGVFAIDDTEEFIAFLRSLKGVHVEVTDSHILVSQE